MAPESERAKPQFEYFYQDDEQALTWGGKHCILDNGDDRGGVCIERFQDGESASKRLSELNGTPPCIHLYKYESCADCGMDLNEGKVKSTEPTPTCSDCGHPKDDSRYHLDAPGTNWGAALHWYVAPAPCPLNESNRTQFESGCSEVVERLRQYDDLFDTIAEAWKNLPFAGVGNTLTCSADRSDIAAIDSAIEEQQKLGSDSWRERRVQELEECLQNIVESAGHTHGCNFMACSCGRVEGFKVALSEATRLLAKSDERREQIRKGAKHE